MNKTLILVISLFFNCILIAQSDKLEIIDLKITNKEYLSAKLVSDEIINSEKYETSANFWYQRSLLHSLMAYSNDVTIVAKYDFETLVKESALSSNKALSFANNQEAILKLIYTEIENQWIKLMNEGVNKFKNESFIESLLYFELALAYKNEDVKTMQYLALAAKKSGKLDQAYVYHEKLSEQDKLDIDGYKSFIYVARELYKSEEDILELYEKAIKAFPTSDYFRKRKTASLIELGKEEKAIRDIKDNIDKFPNNPVFHEQLGLLYHDLYDVYKKKEMDAKSKDYFALAEKYYLQAININEDLLQSNFNLAVLYENQATQKFEKYNSFSPEARAKDKAQHIYRDGIALYKKGLPYLEKARLIDPSDKLVKETLAIFYDRLKDH